MRIFGIGLTRTGTTSLRRAMKILGVDLEWITNVDKNANAAFIQDHMCIPLDRYKSLHKQYPNAKFILTTRKNSEEWYQSICKRSLDMQKNPAIAKQREVQYGYPMPQGHKDHFINIYNSHNDQVKKFFKIGCCGNRYADNFIEFKTGIDGWEKLCRFLNKPIPKVEYPSINH